MALTPKQQAFIKWNKLKEYISEQRDLSKSLHDEYEEEIAFGEYRQCENILDKMKELE